MRPIEPWRRNMVIFGFVPNHKLCNCAMPFAFAFGSTRRRVVLAKPCGGQRGKSIGGVCTRKRAEIGGCLGQTGRPVASGMSPRFGDQLGQIGPLLFDLAGDDAGHVAVDANVSRQQGVHQTLKHIEGRREHLRNIINVPTRHPAFGIPSTVRTCFSNRSMSIFRWCLRVTVRFTCVKSPSRSITKSANLFDRADE